MEYEIRNININSDEEVNLLNELSQRCEEEKYGAKIPMNVAQGRALLAPSASIRKDRWVAQIQENGVPRLIGIAVVFLPLEENTESADIRIEVDPEYRSQGIGKALAQKVKEHIHKNNRTVLNIDAYIRQESETDKHNLPCYKIAKYLNVQEKNTSSIKTLELPLEPHLLEKLEQRVENLQNTYRIQVWTDGIPEEHKENYGIMLSQLERDEPLGDYENQVSTYSAERVDELQNRKKQAGWNTIIAVALTQTGQTAGFCELSYRTDPQATLGYQESTLVMPEHRGKSLALALKIAGHRTLEKLAPHVKIITTSNSDRNLPMNAINKKMGYRVRNRGIDFQSA